MQVQVVVRLLSLGLIVGALVCIGGGLGGIAGSVCADQLAFPPLRSATRAPDAPQRESIQIRKCDYSKTIVFYRNYVTIDHFMSARPRGAGDGLVQHVRWALSRRNFGRAPLRFRRAKIGLHNILYVRTIGIKLAFVFAAATAVLATAVVFTTKQFCCVSNPRVFLVEKVLLIVAICLNIVGGILGILWGNFVHLSSEEKEEKAGVGGLVCVGWVVGGLLLIAAAILEIVDVIVTKAKPPAEEEDGVVWTRSRQGPSGFSSDFYLPSRETHYEPSDTHASNQLTTAETKKGFTDHKPTAPVTGTKAGFSGFNQPEPTRVTDKVVGVSRQTEDKKFSPHNSSTDAETDPSADKGKKKRKGKRKGSALTRTSSDTTTAGGTHDGTTEDGASTDPGH